MSRIAEILLFSILLLHLPSGTLSSRIVSLESVMIFKTHEWFGAKPNIYFQCQGENKTFLPDVKDKHSLYTFKGEESWQPLTELPDKKCKRCGLYEKDKLSDDTFDEWELCPDEFKGPEGRYSHFKDKEFNATFLCPECRPLESGSSGSSTPSRRETDKSNHQLFVAIFVSIVVLGVSVVGAMALYRYWRRKKREEEQARFLKLFEEDDDIEELSLGNVI
ncbi:uncharacterized protein LOC18423555 isoform X2 [Amborella trichopoda]|uniref:DUF7953 domain-containing protein n=1 Tax=Amborella trichopoda TaxID=13333 RepID=W1NKB8_AMBTC|nr:uncharacterized protein LOC18423555 isoform X2 [Amborella trichopoda]ERM95635.1 hypothetical protein AMTR_s00023p00173070 [Amborella trichopoda]|eukprot:XP_006828219.1 uncharacterized protein LOC18423555 isoform X2 [Amborella trichopoda]